MLQEEILSGVTRAKGQRWNHLVKDMLQSVRVIMWLFLWLTHTQFTGLFDIEDNFLPSFLDAIASINGGYGSQ